MKFCDVYAIDSLGWGLVRESSLPNASGLFSGYSFEVIIYLTELQYQPIVFILFCLNQWAEFLFATADVSVYCTLCSEVKKPPYCLDPITVLFWP